MTEERRQAIARAIEERFPTTEASTWSVSRALGRRSQPFRSGSADEEDAFLRREDERAQRPDFAERWPAAVRAMGEDGRLPRLLARGLAAVLSFVLGLVRIVRELGGDALAEVLFSLVLLPSQIAWWSTLLVLRVTWILRTPVDVDLGWRPESRPERVVSHTVVSVRGWWAAGRLVRDLQARLDAGPVGIDPRADGAVAELIRRAGAVIECHEHLATGDPRPVG